MKPPACNDCAHLERKKGSYLCSAAYDLVSGESLSSAKYTQAPYCAEVRGPEGACGQAGHLFEAKESPK